MNKLKSAICVFLITAALLLCGCIGKNPNIPDVVGISTAKPEITAGPTAVPTPVPPPTDTPEPTPVTDPDPDHPYYLYVEKGSYTMTIYSKDENFNYTVVENTYRIGHGGNKTPTGIFNLSADRYRWYDFRLGGSVQYATPYWGNLFIHSPLYAEQDPSRLWPSYYNGDKGIGTSHTGGCLRMVTEAAKFVYENCPAGTKVEIVNGSPKGTTSPDVPPITRKGYDPTDKDALEAADGGN